jgi:hypothetical protein
MRPMNPATLAIAAALVLVAPGHAFAAFPGSNGKQRRGPQPAYSGALRRSAETRCRVTPKLWAICSIVRPSA